MQLYMSLCEKNNCIRIIAFALISLFSSDSDIVYSSPDVSIECFEKRRIRKCLC